MVKRKIGVLVFTQKIKKRGTIHDSSFDGEKNRGINYIVSQINKTENDIKYISYKDINTVDVVLVSLTSHFDIFNLIYELSQIKTIKSKIMVGGHGCFNIKPFIDIIDIACFGRCDDDKINGILNKKNYSNVWRKELDPALENIYEYGECDSMVNGESQVGCKYKCFFCQYGWVNKLISKKESWSITTNETMFKDLDWVLAKKHLTTGLDGISEKTRYIINKPVSKNEIIEKLNFAYNCKTDKRLSLKLFNIFGYPFESKSDCLLPEYKSIFQSVDGKSDKLKIVVTLQFNHFIPMQKTPMAFEKFNLFNFKKCVLDNGYKFFDGKNFEVFIPIYIQSPVPSIEALFVQRATFEDIKIIKNIFLNPKYLNLSSNQKLFFLKQHIPHRLLRGKEIGEPMETDYIKTKYNYISSARIYRKRVLDAYGDNFNFFD